MIQTAQLLDPSICAWDTARFLIFSENVFANYIYYSHLLPAISAIVLGIFVWLRSPRALLNISLLFVMVSFGVWTFLDLILWATEKTQYTMFFWSIQIYFDLLIYAGLLYFFYIFVDQKDVSLFKKCIIAAPFIPVLLLAHTSYNLVGFDFSNCDREALEGPLWQYVYIVELIFTLWIAVLGLDRIRKAKDLAVRRQILLLLVGCVLFLLAFSWGNIVGSLSVSWDLSQYGLFGMPILLSFLAFLITRYRSFGIKILAAQVLITTSILLVLAILFVRTIENVHIIAVVTAVLLAVIGLMLVRSVKKEVEQRERIEKLAKDLELTNQRQESLIHFVGHEVKGFLTKDMGAFAALAEGDLGPLPENMKSFVEGALANSRDGAHSVIEILQASNQKKGTVEYKKEPFDLKPVVEDMVAKLKPIADKKGLAFTLIIDAATQPYTMVGDKGQLGDHVLRNLIENSLNYTPKGSVEVSLTKKTGKIIFAVKDTGIGISEEDKKRLFTEGGHGKESIKVNVHSTGYGLFIAKNIVDAHLGTIRAESDGPGKGSRFVVELPAG